MCDKTVYLVTTTPGGADGRGLAGGGRRRMIAASFSKSAFEIQKHDPRCAVSTIVVDLEVVKAEALAKLTPLDRLVLGL